MKRPTRAASNSAFGAGLVGTEDSTPIKEVPQPPRSRRPEPTPAPAPEPPSEPEEPSRGGSAFGQGI